MKIKNALLSLLMKDKSKAINFILTMLLCPGCLAFWLAGACYMIVPFIPPVLCIMIVTSAIVHIIMSAYYLSL